MMTNPLFMGLDSTGRNRLFEMAFGKTIAFPESANPRILEAADLLQKHVGLSPLLVDKHLVTIHQESTREFLEKTLIKKQKSNLEIQGLSNDPFYVAGCLLNRGIVDAVVGGAEATTAHVVRSAITTVGVAKNEGLITSCFLFSLKQPTAGGQKYLIFADCAVNPDPNAEQLASIASLATQAFEKWMHTQAKVAFLSFSTAGSASHPKVTKMKTAADIFSNKYPSIVSEGEVQFDAAIIPEIAQRKNPSSKLQGQANTLIFPDLDSGNIAYKLTQRLAGAECWGPVLLGTSLPFSDLSRGASALDIAHSAVLTVALQSKKSGS